jgi:hypothetical protein
MTKEDKIMKKSKKSSRAKKISKVRNQHQKLKNNVLNLPSRDYAVATPSSEVGAGSKPCPVAECVFCKLFDSNDVGEKPKIIRAKGDLNLCMFYAIFNVLTPEQKIKFSAENLENPHKAFVDMIDRVVQQKLLSNVKKIKRDRSNDKSREGYTSFDMSIYLHWLKIKKYINSYSFQRIENASLKSIIRPSTLSNSDRTILIMGRTSTHPGIRKALINCTGEGDFHSFSEEQLLEQIIAYESCKLAGSVGDTDSTRHGIVIKIHRGQSIISDTTRKTLHHLTDWKTFIPSLVNWWAMYEFELK